MICVSVKPKSYEEAFGALGKYDFVELRLDGGELNVNEVADLFKRPIRTIAACRKGELSDLGREEILLAAVEAGVNYVDLDSEDDGFMLENVKKNVHNNDCGVIISYHNFEATPQRKELIDKIREIRELGADIIKIACKANTKEDPVRLLSLYDYSREGELLSIGMGELGKVTRVAAPFLGAPFTYASAEAGKKTAPGQFDYETLKTIIESIG